MANKEEKNISTFTDAEIGTQSSNEGEPTSISSSIRTAQVTGPSLQRKLTVRHVQVMFACSPMAKTYVSRVQSIF